MTRRIVLDTNCLIQSISRRSRYYPIWKGFVDGEYDLCVTTAQFIVTNDTHFDVLEDIPFPKVHVRTIDEFLADFV